jgi:hypothetical protein
MGRYTLQLLCQRRGDGPIEVSTSVAAYAGDVGNGWTLVLPCDDIRLVDPSEYAALISRSATAVLMLMNNDSDELLLSLYVDGRYKSYHRWASGDREKAARTRLKRFATACENVLAGRLTAKTARRRARDRR